jgi:sulfatase maturation enzyme AslB (radical SAM superfamily)
MTPKEILTNPCFCPMPWTGLMYNFDGKVKNCIRSVENMPIGNIQNTPIEQIVLGDENVSRHTKIINQQPIPSCQTCYDLERGKKSFNIISDRIFYIRELKQLPMDTYQSGKFDLQTIDVRWSNLCNFACVYCGPEFSSKWSDELMIKTSVPSAEQKENFKQYIYQHAPNLKHVYLAGGEPLLMKENLELLQKLNPSVQLRINTNLSKVDTRIFETVAQFKNVHWTVSVESIEDEFEYIRYGGKWVDFLENLTIINKLDHKINFNMLYFILNYASIFGCIDYFKSLGFHNNSFVIGALLKPDYLNIRHLPENVLQLVKKELESRISESPGYLLEDSYRNMLYYIQQSIEKNLDRSFSKLAELDQRRNLDSSKIFKDLYKLREGKNHGKTI